MTLISDAKPSIETVNSGSCEVLLKRGNTTDPSSQVSVSPFAVIVNVNGWLSSGRFLKVLESEHSARLKSMHEKMHKDSTIGKNRL